MRGVGDVGGGVRDVIGGVGRMNTCRVVGEVFVRRGVVWGGEGSVGERLNVGRLEEGESLFSFCRWFCLLLF